MASNYRTPLPSFLAVTLEAAINRVLLLDDNSPHRLSDETYSDALRRWGEPTTVELLTLVGYFAMVCWLMNVARTPGPAA